LNGPVSIVPGESVEEYNLGLLIEILLFYLIRSRRW